MKSGDFKINRYEPRVNALAHLRVQPSQRWEADHCHRFRVHAVYSLVFVADQRDRDEVFHFSPAFWNISSVSEWLSGSAVFWLFTFWVSLHLVAHV